MTGLLHDLDFFSRHNNPGHAEHAGRLALVKKLPNMDICQRRPATDDELRAAHTEQHIKRVMEQCSHGGGMLDADTYCGPESEIVAREAAGSLVDLALGVLEGVYTNGLALTRPPGHHATSDQAMGFCLYNNIAVAAAALRSRGVPRVAIIDFDVHHGNGTQDIFYSDDAVLYVSSHQYPHYPGSGAVSEIGFGPGVGFTMNHPLDSGAGDSEFLDAYRRSLLPAVEAFNPDFILVSAGYDAHEADPLAELNVSTKGFAHLVEMLVQTAGETCDGRIVFALEGGYEPRALADCLADTAQILISIK
jgi:acetoin utilization deacetylase AcuC-like enzyme